MAKRGSKKKAAKGTKGKRVSDKRHLAEFEAHFSQAQSDLRDACLQIVGVINGLTLYRGPGGGSPTKLLMKGAEATLIQVNESLCSIRKRLPNPNASTAVVESDIPF